METDSIKLDFIQKILENDILTVFFYYILPTYNQPNEIYDYFLRIRKDVEDKRLNVSKSEVKSLLRWIKNYHSLKEVYIVPTLCDKYNIVALLPQDYYEYRCGYELTEFFQACPRINLVHLVENIEGDITGEKI